MSNLLKILSTLSFAATLGAAKPALSQDQVSCWVEDVRIEHLKDGFYVVYGPGGNVGVSVGEEGVFLIDDKVEGITSDILKAVATVSDKEIRFVLNTHWHGDHTGGNETLGEQGAVIVAHDNVRKRLSQSFERSSGQSYEPRPAAALPVLTFNDQASIYLNGAPARAIHFEKAHTDGDSAVLFPEHGLLHTGDIFFNTCYPFIDIETGGTIGGTIAAVDNLLGMIDEDTLVIPGHGPLTDKAGLRAYGGMLKTLRSRVAALKAEGQSLEQVQAGNPSREFDEDWTWSFISGDDIVEFIYRTLPDRD